MSGSQGAPVNAMEDTRDSAMTMTVSALAIKAKMHILVGSSVQWQPKTLSLLLNEESSPDRPDVYSNNDEESSTCVLGLASQYFRLGVLHRMSHILSFSLGGKCNARSDTTSKSHHCLGLQSTLPANQV